MRRRHQMPFGAELRPDGTVRFRLWAPAAATMTLQLDDGGARRERPMDAAGDGWFECTASVAAGTRYRYRLPDGLVVPDPASRFQPDDVHGPSEVIDAEAFAWPDDDWRGRPFHETVLYELHVGTFTHAGTFDGVRRELDRLATLGITAVELMPLADAPGRHGWGYDGVLPYAPEGTYGRPEALKRLVAAAHARGVQVFVDVVYNHFGPEGNYLGVYAPAFFTDRHRTPWGAAIDFSGPRARVVRDFFLHNALYWLEEFQVDGLRLDAVHAIHDVAESHVLYELAETVRARLPAERHVHLVLEDDANRAHFLERDTAGNPRWYTAQWNDDLHHALHVAVTGERTGYYADYADDPVRHLGRGLAEGFIWQGEPSPFRGGAPRGEPSRHLPPTAFVAFLQNHDQVGNRPRGDRLTRLANERARRVAVSVLLLAPQVPLLFMGEEWGSTRPFPFFCDLGGDLGDAVREGRRREFPHAAQSGTLLDPLAPETVSSATLDADVDRATPAGRRWQSLYRRLLRLRRREIVPRLATVAGEAGSATRLGPQALAVRWRLGDGSTLALLANFGSAAVVVAPPGGRRLHATSPAVARRLAAGTLPGWSAAWFLDEPRERRS